MTSETHIQGHSRSCDARAQLRVVRYTGSSSRRTEVVTRRQDDLDIFFCHTCPERPLRMARSLYNHNLHLEYLCSITYSVHGRRPVMAPTACSSLCRMFYRCHAVRHELCVCTRMHTPRQAD